MGFPSVGMFPGDLVGFVITLVLIIVGILVEAVVALDWRRLTGT